MRFPSFLFEKPSRPLVLGKIARSCLLAGVCFRSKCIAKCTPAKLECHPSKCTRSDDARCCILPRRHVAVRRSFSRREDIPPFEKRTLVVFALFSEGLEVRLVRARATKQRNRRHTRGNPSRCQTNLDHDLAFGRLLV